MLNLLSIRLKSAFISKLITHQHCINNSVATCSVLTKTFLFTLTKSKYNFINNNKRANERANERTNERTLTKGHLLRAENKKITRMLLIFVSKQKKKIKTQ